MSTRLRSTIFAGAAFAALGLAPQAFAQNFPDGGFKVINLTGGMQPSVAEIGALCGFDPVADVVIANIKPNEPVREDTTTVSILGEDVVFKARVDINEDDTVNITDLSTIPAPLKLSAQQVDGAEDAGPTLRGGIDGMMFKGGNDISVICAFQRTNVTNISVPGANKIQDVTLVWAKGVCPVAEDVIRLQCDDWNPDLQLSGSPADCEDVTTRLQAEDPANKFDVNALIGQQLGLGSAVRACGFGPLFAAVRCRKVGTFVDSCVEAGSSFVSTLGYEQVTTSASPQEVTSCQDVAVVFTTVSFVGGDVVVTCYKW